MMYEKGYNCKDNTFKVTLMRSNVFKYGVKPIVF